MRRNARRPRRIAIRRVSALDIPLPCRATVALARVPARRAVAVARSRPGSSGRRLGAASPDARPLDSLVRSSYALLLPLGAPGVRAGRAFRAAFLAAACERGHFDPQSGVNSAVPTNVRRTKRDGSAGGNGDTRVMVAFAVGFALGVLARRGVSRERWRRGQSRTSSRPRRHRT